MRFRPARLSSFPPEDRSVIRGQNFTVECLHGEAGSDHAIHSVDETILICPDVGVGIARQDCETEAAARTLVIVPAGTSTLRLAGKGRVFALTTGRTDIAADAIVNGVDYVLPDDRVAPVRAPYALAPSADRVRVYAVDEMPFPPDNPRLKFLQSATMSINWVEYQGQRDRSKLSPHAHEDFEQGSLAIEGDFVHHIRTPWISDAGEWRDDAHINASAQTMLIIPPELIHTTEGVGQGRHILIDVFAPARADFIAKGWVHNLQDYAGATEPAGR